MEFEDRSLSRYEVREAWIMAGVHGAGNGFWENGAGLGGQRAGAVLRVAWWHGSGVLAGVPFVCLGKSRYFPAFIFPPALGRKQKGARSCD